MLKLISADPFGKILREESDSFNVAIFSCNVKNPSKIFTIIAISTAR